MGITDIAATVLPVFGIIGVAYLCRYAGFLSDAAGAGLSSYAFSVAIPCLIFRTMAVAEFPATPPWGYWGAYFAGVASIWAMAQTAVMLWLRRDGETGSVAGFTGAQANTVLVGIPLVLAVYGNAGTAPMVALVSINLPLMLSVAAVLMDVSKTGGANWRATFAKIGRTLALHPIIIAIVLGIVWRYAGLPLSGPGRAVIDAFAGTASTVALFSLGLALHRYGIEGDLRATLLLTGLKLFVHPAIVFALGSFVFDLKGAWLGAAVLFASAPTGVNAYLVASHYGTGIRMSSSAIAVSSALAVVTCGLWLKLIPPP